MEKGRGVVFGDLVLTVVLKHFFSFSILYLFLCHKFVSIHIIFISACILTWFFFTDLVLKVV